MRSTRSLMVGRDRSFPQYGSLDKRARARARGKGKELRVRSPPGTICAQEFKLVARRAKEREKERRKLFSFGQLVCAASKAEPKALRSLLLASSGDGVSSCRLKLALLKPGFNSTQRKSERTASNAGLTKEKRERETSSMLPLSFNAIVELSAQAKAGSSVCVSRVSISKAVERASASAAASK